MITLNRRLFLDVPFDKALMETILPGSRLFLITGAKSLRSSQYWRRMIETFDGLSVVWRDACIKNEPRDTDIDALTGEAVEFGADCILGIGGGSVLDCAKAVSAMCLHPLPVRYYLEGVGDRNPDAVKLPCIAVPTTAGTGSEATSNAVISGILPVRYKKSLRHPAFVPDAAVIDPELYIGCPPDVSAAAGLDAVTQLIEAFVSVKHTIYTDMAAERGLGSASVSFEKSIENGNDRQARFDMAFAAYCSGVALTHAGLGVVHGYASLMGAERDIPHGLACGTLLLPATRTIIGALEKEGDNFFLERYAQVGRILSRSPALKRSEALTALLSLLEDWIDKYCQVRLGSFGFSVEDGLKYIEEPLIKNTPAPLSRTEILGIFTDRL